MTGITAIDPQTTQTAVPTPAVPPADGVFEANLARALGSSAAPPAVLQRFITLGQMAGTMGAAPAAPALGGAAAASASSAPRALSSVDGAPGSGTAVIEAAKRYLGVPYKWGGTNPATGLDCSGFVQRVYADLGVQLPRVSVDQAKQGTAVASLAEAQPGDLVFWQGSPNHIGIYAGDNQMIVAPRTGDVVKFQTISRTPHGIRRIL